MNGDDLKMLYRNRIKFNYKLVCSNLAINLLIIIKKPQPREWKELEGTRKSQNRG